MPAWTLNTLEADKPEKNSLDLCCWSVSWSATPKLAKHVSRKFPLYSLNPDRLYYIFSLNPDPLQPVRFWPDLAAGHVQCSHACVLASARCISMTRLLFSSHLASSSPAIAAGEVGMPKWLSQSETSHLLWTLQASKQATREGVKTVTEIRDCTKYHSSDSSLYIKFNFFLFLSASY